MARSRAGGRRADGPPRVCGLCRPHAPPVDYKDAGVLSRFITDRGRIRSRSTTGNCAQHQREVTMAIKAARELALLPYARPVGTVAR